MKKKEIPKEVLYELYIEKQLSTAEIGRQLGMNKTTVNRKLKMYNIPLREKQQAQKMAVKEYGKKAKEKNMLICPECGKKFYCKPAQQKNSELNFCSYSCSATYYARKRSENLKMIPCDNCETLHHQNQYKIDNFDHHFCSKKCHNEYMKTLIGEKNKKYKRTEIKCSYCGKTLLLTDSQINRSKQYHYYSKECMSKHYEGLVYGENHPSWKGGYSNVYYGPHWKRISESVRKRDNYTCQRCGCKQEDISLSVHHIKPLREFDDYNEGNKEENLITLCPKCHGIVEHYGIDFELKHKNNKNV